MLSINYIQNYLTDDQNKIDNSIYNKINYFEKKYINKVTDDIIYNKENTISFTSTNDNINDNNISNNNIFKLENYCEKIYNSFDILFNLNIADYYYNNRLFRNKSSIFTFLNSIFNIGDDMFNIFDEKTRENIIKKFLKLIDNDLFEKNLYNKFNYSKNRSFNKSDIQNILKYSFQFKNGEKFDLIKQYIADYLGINIYIIHINSTIIDFKKSEYYLTKKFNNNYLKFLPSFLLICENEIYKPVLNKNNSILLYENKNSISQGQNIIDKLWKFLDINNINNNIIINKSDNINTNLSSLPSAFESFIDNNIENLKSDKSNNISNSIGYLCKNDNDDYNDDNNTSKLSISDLNINNQKYKIDFLRNLKITDIKNLCDENNISLKKNSEKTSKLINKLKEELIDELFLIKL